MVSDRGGDAHPDNAGEYGVSARAGVCERVVHPGQRRDHGHGVRLREHGHESVQPLYVHVRGHGVRLAAMDILAETNAAELCAAGATLLVAICLRQGVSVN